MERSVRKEPALAGRLLLAAVLMAVGLAAYLHLKSPFCRALRNGGEIAVAFLSPVPALAVYEPQQRKLTILMGHSHKYASADGPAKAQEVLRYLAAERNPAVLRYVEPVSFQDGRALWNDAKDWVSRWHAQPWLLLKCFSNYRLARHAGATDAGTYEFLAGLLELAKVGPIDICAVNAVVKKNGEPPPAEEPAAKPAALKLEILNASGRKGQAVAVTVHLRRLAAAGELDVDVLTYDNYKRRERKSRIISRTGRIEELSALGAKLGLAAIEITAAPVRASQIDASLVVGEDLRLPEPR